MTTDTRTEHREAALAHVKKLRGQLAAHQAPEAGELAEHLERAIQAFHLEAIRFRMYSLDRLLKSASLPAALTETFEQVRHELEAAGFATRSHTT
jgi:hypothetical protein